MIDADTQASTRAQAQTKRGVRSAHKAVRAFGYCQWA